MSTHPDHNNAVPASPDTTNHPSAHTVSRRPRPTLSCKPCRRKKLKCDRSLPCEQCKRTRRYNECTYDYRPEVSGDPHYSEESEQRSKIPRLDSPLASSANLPSRPLAPAPSSVNADGLQTIEDLQARIVRLEGVIEQSSQATGTSGHVPDHTPSRHKGMRPPAGAFMVKASRSRYHGPSHEINIFHQDALKPLLLAQGALDFYYFTETHTFIRTRVHTSDVLWKEITALQETFPKKSTDASPALHFDAKTAYTKMLALFPSRPICDSLLRIYGTNYESTLRILHMPSFMEEYEAFWRMGDAESSHSTIVPQIMALLVIALSLDDASPPVAAAASLEKLVPSVCCDLVEAWIRDLSDKRRLEIRVIQTQTLLLLAKKTIAVRAERLWLASGELTKIAMMMGLHRDPSEMQETSILEAELRRRLWATVVELDLQISLACGMPSGIRENDSSTLPPSNLNDQDLFGALTEQPKSKPYDQWTDTLIQVILAESLPLRLRAANLFNGGTYREAAYDQGVVVAKELEDLLENLPSVVRYSAVAREASEAQAGRLLSKIFLDVYIRRLLLNVLIPYALRATPHEDMRDLRKKCVESCLIMLSHPEAVDPDVADVDVIDTRKHLDLFYTFCRNDVVLAGFCLCLEMKTMNELSAAAGSRTHSDANSPAQHSTSSAGGHHHATAQAQAQPANNNNNNNSSSSASQSQAGSSVSRAPDQRTVTWSKAYLTRVVENTLKALLVRVDAFGIELKAVFRLALVLQSLRTVGSYERKDELMFERTYGVIKTVREHLATKQPRGKAPGPRTSGGGGPSAAAAANPSHVRSGGGMNGGGCPGGGANGMLVSHRPWEQQQRVSVSAGMEFPIDMDFDISALNNPDFTVNWFLDQAWQ